MVEEVEQLLQLLVPHLLCGLFGGGGGTKSGSADEWLNEAALQDWSALPHACVNTGWAHRAGVRVPYSRPRKPDSPGESVVTITAQCIPLRVALKSVHASSF